MAALWDRCVGLWSSFSRQESCGFYWLVHTQGVQPSYRTDRLSRFLASFKTNSTYIWREERKRFLQHFPTHTTSKLNNRSVFFIKAQYWLVQRRRIVCWGQDRSLWYLMFVHGTQVECIFMNTPFMLTYLFWIYQYLYLNFPFYSHNITYCHFVNKYIKY